MNATETEKSVSVINFADNYNQKLASGWQHLA